MAVLRYDRTPSADGHEIPLQTQTDDALYAIHHLRDPLGEVPIGLWGYSQGAWAAPLAAATDCEAVAFLICVSSYGVTPPEQMLIGCAKQ